MWKRNKFRLNVSTPIELLNRILEKPPEVHINKKKITQHRKKCAEFLTILNAFEVNHHLPPKSGSHIIIKGCNSNSSFPYNIHTEIVHSSDAVCRLSLKKINKIISLADEAKVELKFAICFNEFWGVFTPEIIEAKNGILTLEDFIGENSISSLDEDFNTCSFMFENNITIKRTYAVDHPSILHIQDKNFGELICFEFYYNNKLIFKICNSDSPFYSFLHILRPMYEMFGHEQQKIIQNNNMTTIIDSSSNSDFFLIPEYKLLLSKNHSSYNPTRLIRQALLTLEDLGVNIIVLKQINGYKLHNYKIKYWYQIDN